MKRILATAARVGFSARRCLSDTLITLPGGVSLMISISNDLPNERRRQLMRRVFRSLKPVIREIAAVYDEHSGPEGRARIEGFVPGSDSRRAYREHTVRECSELERLRTTVGLSQVELAELSGVSRYQISRIERGAVRGGARTWARLREALERQREALERQQNATLRNF